MLRRRLIKNQTRILWGLLISSPFLFNACFEDSGTSHNKQTYTSQLQFENFEDSTPFRFHISSPSKSVLEGSCNTNAKAESSSDALCHSSGLNFNYAEENATLILKAKGYHTQKIFLDTLSNSSKITWTKNFSFIKNQDYQNGFDSNESSAFSEFSESFPTENGLSYALKFMMSNEGDSSKIYFINSPRYRLHYDFANQVLGFGGSRTDFDNVTYKGQNRKFYAGTLTWFVDVKTENGSSPICFSFLSMDSLQLSEQQRAFQLVEERILFAFPDQNELSIFFLPNGKIRETELSENKDSFIQNDIPWIFTRDLYANQSFQLMNTGYAVGTLKQYNSNTQNFISSNSDILLFGRLPIELPLVAGVITEERQTPLSHVNIASRSRGTPNLALGNTFPDSILSLIGHLVKYRVSDSSWSIQKATQSEFENFQDSIHPKEVTLEYQSDSCVIYDDSEIGFADHTRIGAKAANIAEMHKIFPSVTPASLAISFGCYENFMKSSLNPNFCDSSYTDCVEENRSTETCASIKTFCHEHISDSTTLQSYLNQNLQWDSFISNSTLREAALNTIRWSIRHTPQSDSFAQALNAKIEQKFSNQKVRLRSSTNAEDLPGFSGAGLYKSVSAYASSDSLHSASSQVRKVWASVWNWRAVEERNWWNISHTSVRMGVQINKAISDESSNGVLITQNIADPSNYGMYVNVQLGESSVTNPVDGSTPEIFAIVYKPNWTPEFSHYSYSSLSPDAPILKESELNALSSTAYNLNTYFANLYQKDPNGITFDLEFKFLADHSLWIKQIRPYSM